MYKILLALTILISAVAAETLKVSTPVDSLHKYSYESQHGKIKMVPNYVKTIVISFEKDNSAMINEFLNKQEPSYLESHNAIFIADINRMPSIITKMFALPKMKKYKHTIYLHNTDKFEKFVPSKDGKATILKFKDKQVKSISYISTIDELKSVLEQ